MDWLTSWRSPVWHVASPRRKLKNQMCVFVKELWLCVWVLQQETWYKIISVYPPVARAAARPEPVLLGAESRGFLHYSRMSTALWAPSLSGYCGKCCQAAAQRIRLCSENSRQSKQVHAAHNTGSTPGPHTHPSHIFIHAESGREHAGGGGGS